MHPTSRRRALVGLAGLLAAAAMATPSGSAFAGTGTAFASTGSAFAGSGSAESAAADRTARASLDRDARLVAATADMPEFGGAFVDEKTGALKVWTTGDGSAVAARLRPKLAALFGAAAGGRAVETLPARYSFATLKRWHDQMTGPVLRIPGAVLTDIDERTNRLIVGLADPAAQGPNVRGELERVGIPVAAVTIRQVAPIQPMTLQDRVRPIVGGVQVHMRDAALGFSVFCTLGFNAVRAGVSGFVTNSHCTRRRGSDNTVAYQNYVVENDTLVGTEAFDTELFSGSPCPAGRVCRFSDASFIRNTFASSSLGRIALPANPDSIAWNGVDTQRITNLSWASVGNVVAKVGRTTGRTAAVVDYSCANASVANTNITMLCQEAGNLGVRPGDSGSTVYQTTHSPSFLDATLLGIAWGGQEAPGLLSIWSGTDMVTGELGAMSLCGAVC